MTTPISDFWEEKESLSSDAIAGIAIGSAAVVLTLISVGIYFSSIHNSNPLYRKAEKHDLENNVNSRIQGQHQLHSKSFDQLFMTPITRSSN
jgi:hypothetical protein